MFYFFSKTLNYLLTSAGWLVAVLLFALLTRNQRRRRWAVGIGLGIFYLFGNSFLINELALWWEYPVPQTMPTRQSVDSTQAIAVVLTGGMVNVARDVPDGHFLLGREADRAGQALYLYRIGAVQKILISGGTGKLPFRAESIGDEGQLTAQFLRMAGVRPGDIVLEGKSINTHENAVFTSQLLSERFRTNRCVLVTSASHMRRAVACFQNAGVDVTPFSSGFLSAPRQFALGEWLLPNEQAFENAHALTKEMAGYAVYWVIGYL